MQNTPFHIVIPARYKSTRLPGKPLLDIAGKPMIQHVVERCMTSHALSVTVATDDKRIAQCVENCGGNVVMTSEEHQTGADRIAEACATLSFSDQQIVINVQGDEPEIPVSLIQQVAECQHQDDEAAISTACVDLDDVAQYHDPSVVKVVRDQQHYALYFSRCAIPATPTTDQILLNSQRHIGIYAYRVGYIKTLTTRPASPLEKIEKLEQLRALWYGDKIKCVDAIATPPPGIDTQQDLDRIRRQYHQ